MTPIELLERAAADAEDMSKWDDREAEHGAGLKAKAASYREAATILRGVGGSVEVQPSREPEQSGIPASAGSSSGAKTRWSIIRGKLDILDVPPGLDYQTWMSTMDRCARQIDTALGEE